jgi:hypothetical protein
VIVVFAGLIVAAKRVSERRHVIVNILIVVFPEDYNPFFDAAVNRIGKDCVRIRCCQRVRFLKPILLYTVGDRVDFSQIGIAVILDNIAVRQAEGDGIQSPFACGEPAWVREVGADVPAGRVLKEIVPRNVP